MLLKLTFLCALIIFYCIELGLTKTVDTSKIAKGLYVPTDKVQILGGKNFHENVVDSSVAWLVEFYNTWCGHCVQFAPVWKEFAASVSSWNKVVKIGVVDCANEDNSDLCREYEIMAYPTLRYFVPHTPKDVYGNDTTKSYNIGGMRKKLIKMLLDTPLQQDWPLLSSYKADSVFDVWSKVPVSVKYAAFFVEQKSEDNKETESSDYKGVEFILDMSAIPEVYATRIKADKAPALQLELSVLPGVAIVTRGNDIIPLTTEPNDNTHEKRLEVVKKYLRVQGIHEPDETDTESDTAVDTTQDMNKKTYEGDFVFQVDLETALRYSLERDVPLKSLNIDGKRLDALKFYISVLAKYFPINENGRKFIFSVNASLTKTFTPDEFQHTVRELIKQYEPFLMKEKSNQFIACDSQYPGLRGYPCSLWTMFHTLTVAAANKPELSTDPKEVLHAMHGYVKHFFSCSECSNNFMKETETLEKEVKTLNDSILYLWRTHNHVNKRLHEYPGNRTEDPDHPKIQFPSKKNCPQCYSSSGDWNETAVLNYLKSIYTHINNKTFSKVQENHIQTKRETHVTPLVIDTRYFNMFDISLCVMLYFASVGILILVGLKFCLKKTHRRKTFIYDILSKA